MEAKCQRDAFALSKGTANSARAPGLGSCVRRADECYRRLIGIQPYRHRAAAAAIRTAKATKKAIEVTGPLSQGAAPTGAGIWWHAATLHGLLRKPWSG